MIFSKFVNFGAHKYTFLYSRLEVKRRQKDEVLKRFSLILGQIVILTNILWINLNFITTFLQVLFKKVIGNANYGQISLFFSLIGLLNAALLWPLCLTLYFTGVEILYWDYLPWPALFAASGLSLGTYHQINPYWVGSIRGYKNIWTN